MKVSKQEVQKAVRRIYGAAKVKDVTDLSGRINLVYRVDISNPSMSMVLKLNAFPEYDWRLEKERYVTELINEHTDISVPFIYLVDNSKEIFPAQYTLMSRIDGENLKSLLPKIDSDERGKLVEEAGECLGKINSINFQKFGSIRGKGVIDGVDSFEDHFHKSFEKTISRLSKTIEIRGLVDNAKEFLEKNIQLAQIPVEPCLVHYDYTPENIIIRNREVSGILDFEACRASHNELDFVQVENTIFDLYPEIKRQFLDGYQKHSLISAEFERRQKLYKIQFYLNLVFFERDPNLKREYTRKVREILRRDTNGLQDQNQWNYIKG